jgi:RNA 2',3'-cyclic 3'-phosphodiesterase
LGEISSSRLAAIKEAMNAVDVPPFFLHIGGFGYFRREGGDIFWAGVERSQALMTLYRQLYTQLQNRGFQLEKRGYRPHLTLARQAVLKQEYDHSAFVVPAMKMQVGNITLFHSQRQCGKLRYTPVYNKMLGSVK